MSWFLVRAVQGRADVMARSADMLYLSMANKELSSMWQAFKAKHPERFRDVCREILVSVDVEEPPDIIYERLAGRGFMEATEYCDRDWFARNLTGFWLITGLREAGLLEGADEAFCEKHFEGDDRLCALLETKNIVVASKDALVEMVQDPGNTLTALRSAGFLNRDIGRDWLAGVLAFDEQELLTGLTIAGLLTPECGRDWYVDRLTGRALLHALDKTGLLAQTDGDWLVGRFFGTDRIEALGAAGQLAQTPDWYARHFSGFTLQAMLALAATARPA